MFDRRGFLHSTAGVFFTAASSRVFGAGAPSSRVRLAMVGCHAKGRGIYVMRAALATPGVEIACVCDVDSRARDFAAAEVKRVTGVAPRKEKDLRKVLEDPLIDGIISVTPDHWHAYSAVLAMNAGKHVYVEKPCCFCPREGEILVDTWKKSDCVLQVGSQRRSSANVAAAIDLLHSPKNPIGPLKRATCWYMGGRRSFGKGRPAQVPEWLDWDLWQGPAPRTGYRSNYVHYNWHWFRRWGTGETGNNAPHFADIARWALGAGFPERVVATGGMLFPKGDDYEWHDTCDFSLEYPGSRVMTFEVASHTKDAPRLGATTGCVVYGSAGSVRFLPDDTAEIVDENGRTIKKWDHGGDTREGSRTNPTATLDIVHMTDFAQCIRSGSKGTRAPADEGYMSSYVPLVANIALDVRESLRIDPATGRVTGNTAAQALWRREYEKGWDLLDS